MHLDGWGSVDTIHLFCFFTLWIRWCYLQWQDSTFNLCELGTMHMQETKVHCISDDITAIDILNWLSRNTLYKNSTKLLWYELFSRQSFTGWQQDRRNLLCQSALTLSKVDKSFVAQAILSIFYLVVLTFCRCHKEIRSLRWIFIDSKKKEYLYRSTNVFLLMIHDEQMWWFTSPLYKTLHIDKIHASKVAIFRYFIFIIKMSVRTVHICIVCIVNDMKNPSKSEKISQ